MAEKRTTYKIQDLGGIGEVHSNRCGRSCFHGRKYHQ